MRTFAALCGAMLLGLAIPAAHAEVATGGTFTATQTCPAYQSIRKSTNPGDVNVEPAKVYAILAKNKDEATYYRLSIEGAQPAERWVSATCGTIDVAGVLAPIPGQPASAGARATHVLAMSWEPAFCSKHKEKTECRELTPESFGSKNLSLHGLWPQPRGTQYCNVPANDKKADMDRRWNDLPEPQMSADTQKRLAAVMPGVKSNLQRHEWIVHGTCFGSNANAYFARSADLAEAVNASKVSRVFAENAGKTLSASAIRAAFDESFGAGAGARVTVSCNGRGANRKITEVIMSLAGDVTGSGGLGDLLRAAQPISAGCPGGLVHGAPN
ncbi:MAG: ribonuclease [Hyphomicrobiaceae bacterium]